MSKLPKKCPKCGSTHLVAHASDGSGTCLVCGHTWGGVRSVRFETRQQSFPRGEDDAALARELDRCAQEAAAQRVRLKLQTAWMAANPNATAAQDAKPRSTGATTATTVATSGLNPSNGNSERITGRKTFPNVAGMGRKDPAGVDDWLEGELKAAGITAGRMAESMRERSGGEPKSVVIGTLHGWSFRRAWYYWMVEGPGIPVDDAERLHEKHGTSVRVHGHCGCPSPREYCQGFPTTGYHVDNQEGLNALADMIREVKDRSDRVLAGRLAEVLNEQTNVQ